MRDQAKARNLIRRWTTPIKFCRWCREPDCADPKCKILADQMERPSLKPMVSRP